MIIYACTRTHARAHTHTHTHTHRPACTCREWQPCSGSIPGTHTHTHAHTHTHTHTYIPTHFSTQDCMRFAESSSFVQLASLAHSPTHTLTLPRRPVCVSQRAAASSRQQPWCSPPAFTHTHTHTHTHTRAHTLSLSHAGLYASRRERQPRQGSSPGAPPAGGRHCLAILKRTRGGAEEGCVAFGSKKLRRAVLPFSLRS